MSSSFGVSCPDAGRAAQPRAEQPRANLIKTLEIELPDALAARLEELVEAGWFTSEAETGRLALEELLRRCPFELGERFQREDIAWALVQTAQAETLSDQPPGR